MAGHYSPDLVRMCPHVLRWGGHKREQVKVLSVHFDKAGNGGKMIQSTVRLGLHIQNICLQDTFYAFYKNCFIVISFVIQSPLCTALFLTELTSFIAVCTFIGIRKNDNTQRTFFMFCSAKWHFFNVISFDSISFCNYIISWIEISHQVVQNKLFILELIYFHASCCINMN